MGKLEEESGKRTKRKNLQKYILASVALAGMLSVGLLAPNVFGALVKLGIKPPKRQKEFIKASRDRLVKRGLLVYRNGMLRLTEKGERLRAKLELYDFQLKKPKRWDKKWRILIFDIPQKQKTLRDKVRRTLIAIGFIRLQNSVWIYPYDCEDLITLLKADFKIGKNLLYMIVDSLEYDSPVRKQFNLLD